MLCSEYHLLVRSVGRVMLDQRFGFSILGRFKGACHDTLSNNLIEYSTFELRQEKKHLDHRVIT